jgi:hypothetical protein
MGDQTPRTGIRSRTIGTTAERDSFPREIGDFHYNTDISGYQEFTIGGWNTLAGGSGTLELFEFDSGFDVVNSSSFGAPVTINFGMTFAEPPVVNATLFEIAFQHITVKEVTTTGFTVYAGTASADIMWVASTTGLFDLGNGVIFQSGYVSSNESDESVDLNVYQTGKTPSLHATQGKSDDAAGSEGAVSIGTRAFGGGTTTNLNFAGRNASVRIRAASAGSVLASFLLVSQTSTVQTGNTTTGDGAQGLIGTKNFEAGTNLEVTTMTPSHTFVGTFAGTPATLITGEVRTSILNAATGEAHLSGTGPSTISTLRLASADARTFYNYLAVDQGPTSFMTPRLG